MFVWKDKFKQKRGWGWPIFFKKRIKLIPSEGLVWYPDLFFLNWPSSTSFWFILVYYESPQPIPRPGLPPNPDLVVCGRVSGLRCLEFESQNRKCTNNFSHLFVFLLNIFIDQSTWKIITTNTFHIKIKMVTINF